MRKELSAFFSALLIPEDIQPEIVSLADKLMGIHNPKYVGKNDWFWNEQIELKQLGRRHALTIRYYLIRIIQIYKTKGQIDSEEIINSDVIEDPLSEIKQFMAEIDKEERDLDRMRRHDGPYCSSCESSPCQCSDPERTSSLF